jgi:5-methylcytosine-specific restriction endonuclease McrA
MAALHALIAEARQAGRFPVVHINAQRLMIETCPMTTRQIGREWLNLLQGRPSVFEDCVDRFRSVAPGRKTPSGWGETRLRVFERDGHRCTYCGSTEQLECDHIIPVAKGGSHDDNNLTTACRSCNRRKRDRMPEEWHA